MDSIRTERLLLRPFTPDDADDVYAIFSLPEVARWSGRNGEPMAHRDEAVARIASFPQRAGPHPASGVFAMVPTGEQRVVGMALLVPIPLSSGDEPQDFEIGWHLHPDGWGRGLATEAGSALVDRAWAAEVPRLLAVTDPANVRSQAVCARLGMTDLGMRVDWHDRNLRAFGLTRP